MDGKAILQGPNVLTVSAENVHHSFFLPDLYSLKLVSLQSGLLLRSADPVFLIQLCSLNPLFVYSSPAFLFQLCVITPPFCSTLYSQHTVLPEGWGFSSSPDHPVLLSAYVCICLSFLHSLLAPVKSIPGAIQKCSKLSCAWEWFR